MPAVWPLVCPGLTASSRGGGLGIVRAQDALMAYTGGREHHAIVQRVTLGAHRRFIQHKSLVQQRAFAQGHAGKQGVKAWAVWALKAPKRTLPSGGGGLATTRGGISALRNRGF